MTKDPSPMHKERRGRNYALAFALMAFMVLIVVVTMIKIGGAG